MDLKSRPKGLTAAERLTYQQQGYVVVRDVFDAADVSAWQTECDRLLHVLEGGWTDDLRLDVKGHATLGRIRDRIDPVSDISPVFQKLAADPRVQAVVASLLDGPASVFKDKLIFKRPGTSGYAAHQDYASYGAIDLPPEAMVTLLISIDPANADNGALELFSGLHGSRLPSRPGDPRNLDETRLPLNLGQIISTTPRDVIAFHSLAPHRSGPNRSDRARRALFLTFSAARFGSRYRDYYEHRFQVMSRSRSIWHRLRAKLTGQARVR